MASLGEVKYKKNLIGLEKPNGDAWDNIDSIGPHKVRYGLRGNPTHIGEYKIHYGIRGRIVRVGDWEIKRGHYGLIRWIGPMQVHYRQLPLGINEARMTYIGDK